MNNYTFNNAAGVLPRWLRQTLLVMRITALILLVGLLQVSASSLAQKISIDKKNTSIQSVLNEISKQSGYDFFYDANALKKIKPVSISIQNADLNEAVKKSLSGLPLSYSIENKTVIIKEKTPSILDKVAAIFAEDLEIRGQVVNKKTNEPLSGVSIKIKNKKINSGTNIRGEFSVSKLDPNSIITFSFVGFDSVQVRLGEIQGLQDGGNLFSKNVSITKISEGYFVTVSLEPSISYLDEMIVQGYGTTDRRMATGNIARVTAAEIEKQPVMNPLLALAGRVPGMVVTPNGGYASGVVKVEIRGRSTISKNFTSDPLYIIDGVPLTYLEIGGNSNYENGSSGVMQGAFPSVGGGQSPLFNLNPTDIASIEVLKDADATAIYGSRGANGVILITTKKGKIGGTSITANFSQGISKVTHYWDMLNTQQYLDMRRQAFKNDGVVPTLLNAPDLMVWDSTRYTNWQKELWGGTGKMTNMDVALSGGNESTQFRIGGNYTRQTEILTASGANRKASLIFNLSNYSLNRKLKTNLSVNYSYSDVNNVPTPSAVTLAPNAPPIYTSDGNINYQEWNDAGMSDRNPFSSIKSIIRSETNLLMANLNLAYELFRGFEISSNFGYNNSHNLGGGMGTIASQNPIDNPTGSATYLTNDNQNWIVEPQFNYKTDIGKGRFSALLGATMQATKGASQTIVGLGYEDDNLLGSIALAPFKMYFDKSGQYKYAAVFGRVNYTWDDKYVINVSGRRDGSSRFGKGKQYGNFGALGLAWIVSQESWIKNILPSFVSFIKLRGSYGITGSDGVGEYQYLTQWSSAPNYVPLYTYGGITPLASMHAVNPDYRWQENKKTEGGLSLSFLKDRINLEVAYYSNRCNNQLLLLPTPILTGFKNVTANSPADIRNSGWEVTLSAKLINTKNFSWTVNMNGSVNKNVLLDYPDLEHSPYATEYFIGRSLNAKYLLHYTGINPLNGQYTYEDYGGDGMVRVKTSLDLPGTNGDDRYVLTTLDPKFIGGFGNDFQYKSWNLSLFFQYKNQMGYNSSYIGQAAGSMLNIGTDIYSNHWQQPGQQAKYARFTTLPELSDSYVNTSDLGYTDASYLRLNNVSLSYTVPEKVMKNKRLSIFVHAQNLWVYTKYQGIDPDTQSFGAMPTAKVITAGLSLTL